MSALVRPLNYIYKNNLTLPTCIITNRHRWSYVNIINPTHEEKKLKSNSILSRCFSVNDGKVIKWVNQISDVTKDIKINENQNSNKSKSTIKFDLSQSELNHQQK
jgi:hypothetical protein